MKQNQKLVSQNKDPGPFEFTPVVFVFYSSSCENPGSHILDLSSHVIFNIVLHVI